MRTRDKPVIDMFSFISLIGHIKSILFSSWGYNMTRTNGALGICQLLIHRLNLVPLHVSIPYEKLI